MSTDKDETLPASPAALAKGKKFRVLHAAVSGVGPNRKGEIKDRDFYKGSTVTADQLDGNDAYYISIGAIEEI